MHACRVKPATAITNRANEFSCSAPVNGPVSAELRKVTAPTVRGHLSPASPAETRKIVLLNSSPFRRTAPVVRQRRHVLDTADLQAGVLKIQHRLLATRAGPLDLDFHF